MVFAIFCPYRRSNGSPLYYAALCGLHDLTEHLVSKDPGQVNAHGGYHETPLIAALAGEHFRTAELLIRNGADAAVNLPGILQRTALHSAAFYGFVEVSRFLLKHGADVNLREARGKTPLHLPSEGGGSRKGPDVPRMVAEAARLLLQYGADVNAPRDDGMTPLHVAAECGSVQVARVLLEHGANVDAKDSDGSTAFQVALNGKSVEMRNLFLQHGATTPL
ncbi:ankyrin repeat-containing domain protein [Russula earlei]|uniref:Ankyrin repeat-containing domain protein n=1 Tax=Russula earlei TaxID=71964 RepID=A0ACC0TZR0_9AGAM|nr:ankyrin repeat-containing domain protein [Russula earlei]